MPYSWSWCVCQVMSRLRAWISDSRFVTEAFRTFLQSCSVLVQLLQFNWTMFCRRSVPEEFLLELFDAGKLVLFCRIDWISADQKHICASSVQLFSDDLPHVRAAFGPPPPAAEGRGGEEEEEDGSG
ncbi:hypothetical protein XENOCAPTIV_029596 [Xenoophorus captivus]|uniref:Uncharacterized protein n=1 Tax=Xenoophorus captivus TaxID=1517983 RepID=A0ABV0Q6W4_9TELE